MPDVVRKVMSAARTKLGFFLIGILLVTFLLRIPSLFEPPWYDDEGIYAAIGDAILNGATLYREALDNRPPPIYLLYGLLLKFATHPVLYLRLLAALWVAATQLVIFMTCCHLMSRQRALLSSLIFGLLLSLPIIEGNIANVELFMILPSSLGMLLLLRGNLLLSGISFGAAASFKPIAGLDFVAAALALLLLFPSRRRSGGWLLFGFALPLTGMTAYFLMKGMLPDFLFATFTYYGGYLQRGTTLPPYFFLIKGGILLLFLLHLWRQRQVSGGEEQRGLILLWLLFALLGSLFTGRPYPHYLIQAAPPLSIALVMAYRPLRQWGLEWRNLVPATAGLALVIVLVATFGPPYVKKGMWQRLYYYPNFVDYALGRKPVQEYNSFFDRRVNRNLALVSFLRETVRRGEYTLIWGDDPWIYPLGRLRNPTRFSIAYYAYEIPGGLQEIADAVRRRQPEYVVRMQNKPLFSQLGEELNRSYSRVATLQDAEIYVRKQGNLPSNAPENPGMR